MRRIHIELILQLRISYNTRQILRQRRPKIVVLRNMRISIKTRNQKAHSHHQILVRILRHMMTDSVEVRKNRLMMRLPQRLIKHKNHRRKNRHTGKDTEQNTFTHDQAQIHAERKAHEAQRNEARNRRYRRSDDR